MNKVNMQTCSKMTLLKGHDLHFEFCDVESICCVKCRST